MGMIIGSPWDYPSSGYEETGYFGYTADAGTNATNNVEDFKFGNPLTVPAGGVWVKHMYMTFEAGTFGCAMRPVLYSGSGVSTDPLFYEGQDFTCPTTFTSTITELGPMTWQASGDAIFLPEGDYTWGMMFGTAGMHIRAAEAVLGPLLRTPDIFSNGASPTFGTISSFTAYMLMRMPYSVTGP